jgi:hypothetical protein
MKIEKIQARLVFYFLCSLNLEKPKKIALSSIGKIIEETDLDVVSRVIKSIPENVSEIKFDGEFIIVVSIKKDKQESTNNSKPKNSEELNEELNLKEFKKDIIKKEEKAYIEEVFNFWKEEMGFDSRALTDSRLKTIKKALKNYTVLELKDAIRGVKLSKFHMGENEAGTLYNDIDNIMREDTRIDKHIERYNRKEKSKITSSIADNIIKETISRRGF